MRLLVRLSFAASVLAVLALGAALPRLVTPGHAQLSASGTWVGSNVGGAANALTITVPGVGSMNDLLGVPIRLLPQSNNAAGTATVNVNGLGAYAVDRLSGGALVPIAGGDFSTNVLAEIMWDGAEFVHKNPATGTEPVGKEGDFTNTVPAGWLVENGQCISQTTYAALYTYYGGTDLYSPGSTGGACSSGNFHVKFSNGRASIAADTQGGVTAGISSTYCGSTIPSTCGNQNRSIGASNLPTGTFPVSTSFSNSASLSVSTSFSNSASLSVSTTNSGSVDIPAGQGSHNHASSSDNTLVFLKSPSNVIAGGNGWGTINANTGSSTSTATLPDMSGTFSGSGSGTASGTISGSPTGTASGTISGSPTGTATLNGGSQTALQTLQPSSVVLKAVKY